MAFFDGIKNRLQMWLLPEEFWSNSERRVYRDRLTEMRAYANGMQRRQIKVKANQADDNLVINFTGLIVERSISMLFGGGVEFDFDAEAENEPDKQYVDDVWDANKRGILMHKLAQYGATAGTSYLKILPGENGKLPRLVPQDPLYMWIRTHPEDIDTVLEYECLYSVHDGDEVIGHKELTTLQDNGTWLISRYISTGKGRWDLLDEVVWDYDFPPILHWQNLPNADSPYGRSDIEDVMELQNKVNFIAGNINKIIRYHAHPKTWGRGLGAQSSASWGPDEMVTFTGDGAHIENLEMHSDLTSSQQYLMVLRQALFDVSRTVDISSMNDKLGALTNFGLRVLYTDALAKNGTKRELWTDALSELNRRLLVLNGDEAAEGGEVIWSDDVLPVDERDAAEVMRIERDLGLVSRQTLSAQRGYQWEREQQRISEEQAQGDNIGAQILRSFNIGGNA